MEKDTESVLRIPRAKLRKLSACENRLLLLYDGKFQFMHAPTAKKKLM